VAAAETARVLRGLRKKLQQVEDLEERAAQQGRLALDPQQRAKLRRKPLLLEALTKLEGDLISSSEALELISQGQAGAPPSSSPPLEDVRSRSNTLEAPVKGSCESVAAAASQASAAPEQGNNKGKSRRKQRSRKKLAAQDCAAEQSLPAEASASCTPASATSASPSTSAAHTRSRTPESSERVPDPEPLPTPCSGGERSRKASLDMTKYNWTFPSRDSTSAFPSLGEISTPPAARPKSATPGFHPRQGAPRTRVTAQKPSKPRKGGLSMFLSGGLDAHRPSPSTPAGAPKRWTVPRASGSVSLKDIQDQELELHRTSNSGETPSRPSASWGAPQGQGSKMWLGDFLTEDTRGHIPPVWGSSLSNQPAMLRDIQAAQEEHRKSVQQPMCASASPPCKMLFSSMSPSGASPSKWYLPDEEILPVSSLQAIQAAEEASRQQALLQAKENQQQGGKVAAQPKRPKGGKSNSGGSKHAKKSAKKESSKQPDEEKHRRRMVRRERQVAEKGPPEGGGERKKRVRSRKQSKSVTQQAVAPAA